MDANIFAKNVFALTRLILGAEFSQAEIHTAGGISIRFPRVTRIRNDKMWESATSFAELRVLFENSKQKTDYSHLFKNTSHSDTSGMFINFYHIEIELNYHIEIELNYYY